MDLRKSEKALRLRLTEDKLNQLTTPSNMRLAKEIIAHGGVQFLTKTPAKVTAKVKSGQRRTTSLSQTPEGIRCLCSCAKEPGFCKHGVAVALALNI